MKAIFSFIFFLLTCFTSIAQTEKNVLFIGNSYTYVNDLPGIIQEIALSKGNIFSHQSHTPGGSTLEQHASNPTVQNLLNSEEWDYVILQAQSQQPAFSPSQVASQVYPHAASLSEDIRLANLCAEPVFFMTWGRENGDANNCPVYPPVCTYEGMQDRLTESYTEMAEDNNALLAPVGTAWKNIRANYPNIDLYLSDGSHPSNHGTYLAACVIYSVLFNESPINAFYPNWISSADADIIQETAYNSTQENEINFTLVPEAYVNCAGDCLNDSDGDGVCDENEAPTCPEDLNSDGYITTQDLLLILSEFGCTSSCEYDITQDNYVAVDDVLQILSGFGNVCETSGFQNCGDLVYHEGYDYSTVQIGDQCWFSENCRYLPDVFPSNEQSSNEPHYYVYGYEGTNIESAKGSDNYEIYGVLYNRPAVVTDDICPLGWHIASDEEWQTLEISLGMSESIAMELDFRGTNEGAQMKSISGWFFNGNGTNTSGLNSRPGGLLAGIGFYGLELHGFWWTSTFSENNYLVRQLVFGDDSISRQYESPEAGLSARCVRD